MKKIYFLITIILYRTHRLEYAGFVCLVLLFYFFLRYAGVLTGMTGTLANIAAMLAPIVTFQLTKNVLKNFFNYILH